MLLVGIVANPGRVVLGVDAALCLETGEAAAAGIGRQNDLFGGVVGPGKLVAADHRRPIDGVKTLALILDRVGRILSKPPDLEQVGPRDGIDRDDGARVRAGEPGCEGIDVGFGVKRRTAALEDVTGQVISGAAQFTGRRSDSVTHIGSLIKIPGSATGGNRPRAGGGGAVEGHVMTIAAAVVGNRASLIKGELGYQAGRAGGISASLHVHGQLLGGPGRGPDAQAVQRRHRERVRPIRFSDEIVQSVGVIRRMEAGLRSHKDVVKVDGQGGRADVKDSRQMYPLVHGQQVVGGQGRVPGRCVVRDVGPSGRVAGQREKNILLVATIAEVDQPLPQPALALGRGLDPAFDRVTAAIEIDAGWELTPSITIQLQVGTTSGPGQIPPDVNHRGTRAPEDVGAEGGHHPLKGNRRAGTKPEQGAMLGLGGVEKGVEL